MKFVYLLDIQVPIFVFCIFCFTYVYNKPEIVLHAQLINKRNIGFLLEVRSYFTGFRNLWHNDILLHLKVKY